MALGAHPSFFIRIAVFLTASGVCEQCAHFKMVLSHAEIMQSGSMQSANGQLKQSWLHLDFANIILSSLYGRAWLCRTLQTRCGSLPAPQPYMPRKTACTLFCLRHICNGRMDHTWRCLATVRQISLVFARCIRMRILCIPQSRVSINAVKLYPSL